MNSKNNRVERNGGGFQRRLELENRQSALTPSLPCHQPTGKTSPSRSRTLFLYLYEDEHDALSPMNHKHVSLKTQCGQTPHLLHQDLRSMGIGMHPHPSHLASPQRPHLVPPLLSDPPALNYAPSPAHDDVRLVPNPIAPQPRPSHPSICTPNLLISHHHKHHTWRILHYLTHLP